MPVSEPDPKDARAIWSAPGWLTLFGELISGLGHDVTGRASALSSLSMVASRGLADSDMVTEELEREARQLSTLSQVVEAFPTANDRDALGLSLADLVSRLAVVLRLATRFRDLEVELELPPTLPAAAVPAGPVSVALLLALAQSASDSRDGHCRALGVASGSTVSVTLMARDPKRIDQREDPWLDDEAVQGISALAATWGGSFVPEHENGRYVLTAPTL